jgi:large repetitive protein
LKNVSLSAVRLWFAVLLLLCLQFGVNSADANFNRAINVAVRFPILSGDAKFTANAAVGAVVSADGKSLVVPTDKNGLAAARPQLGETTGNIKISAKAVDAPEAAVAAVFQVVSLLPQTGPTKLAGVVLDHRGTALAGVRLSISRTNLPKFDT